MPSFLEELQAMSESRKRQVLIISTVVIMALVVGVWLAYFNSVVMGGASGTTDVSAVAGTQASATSTSAPAPAPAATAPVSAGSSLWARMKEGFASIERMFSGGPSQYSIQPQQ
jgi:hypothetical protein